MKILAEVAHPGDVHCFKYIFWELEKRGHEVKILAIGREITTTLLDLYDFEYEFMGKNKTGLLNKMFDVFRLDIKVLRITNEFKPEIFLGRGSFSLAHISFFKKKPFICSFADTEGASFNYYLAYPFANVIMTPSCYQRKLSPKKHIEFNGYTELAYLHPNWFKPDSSVLDDLCLTKYDKFIIVRFSSWDATHDIGKKAFKSMEERIEFIKILEKYGKVFITSEITLPKSLDKNMLSISPEKIHDLLYYATMYIGGGATMASEAGVLGVPWIWISAGEMLGYLDDQEENYGLGYSIKTPQQALERAIELLESDNLKNEWQKKRKKLLNEKMDVTKFMVWFIENYPESFEIMKENSEYQGRFK